MIHRNLFLMPVLYLFFCGVSLLGIATALYLDGPTRTIALLIEAAWFYLIGRNMTRGAKDYPLLLAPLLAPIVLSLASIESSAWRMGFFHMDALMLVLTPLVLVMIGSHLREMRHRLFTLHKHILVDLEHTVWITAGLFGVVFVWLISHAVFEPDWERGTMFAICAYLFSALFAYLAGRAISAPWKTAVGIVTVCISIALISIVDEVFAGLWGGITVVLSAGTIALWVLWEEREAMHRGLSLKKWLFR